LDELINLPTEAEERSMIQISFRTQDPNINPEFAKQLISQLMHNSLCFQNTRIRSIYRLNQQSVLFVRPNPLNRKPIHPPPLIDLASGKSRLEDQVIILLPVSGSQLGCSERARENERGENTEIKATTNLVLTGDRWVTI